jgi:hypothetical protein
MAKFLFAYRAPVGYSGSPDGPERWRAWFKDLGSHVDEIGNPTFSGQTIGECGQSTQLGGYSMIDADSLEQAAELARGCPILSEGGGVDIGELTILN